MFCKLKYKNKIQKSIIVLFAIICNNLYAQLDHDFWFALPEVSNYHELDNVTKDKYYVRLDVSADEKPAYITIIAVARNIIVKQNIYVPAKTAITDTSLNSYKEILECNVIDEANVFVSRDTSNSFNVYGRMKNGLRIIATSKPYNSQTFNANGLLTDSSKVNVTLNIGRSRNLDIFTLKGRNGLGSEFFTSFQTDLNNGVYPSSLIPPVSIPYSGFDVIITEDSTYLTLNIPTGKSVFNKNGVSPLTGTIKFGPFMKGETYSGVPGKITKDINTLGSARLSGLRIKATKGKKNTNANVAVMLKDDSMTAFSNTRISGGCRDLAGDQTIPTNIIGSEYIAIRGNLYHTRNGAKNMERVYLIATQNNTSITINGITDPVPINRGDTYSYYFSNTDTLKNVVAHIKATNSVYALQITGFGCEQGAAILPSISTCTGSYEVNFVRSMTSLASKNSQLTTDTTKDALFINILAHKYSKSFFTIKKGINFVADTTFGASKFTDIDSTEWAYARIDCGDSKKGCYNKFKEYISQTIKSEDVFHLGLIYGGAGTGTRYGYFSNYNVNQAQGVSQGSNSQLNTLCSGQSDTLEVKNINLSTLTWSPELYISDIHSKKIKVWPPVSMDYTATAYGACHRPTSVKIQVRVSPNPDTDFDIDKPVGCSPHTISIKSKGKGNKYQWIIQDTATLEIIKDTTWFLSRGYDKIMLDTSFSLTLQNKLSTSRVFKISQVINNQGSTCFDTLHRFVTVKPTVRSKIIPNKTTICDGDSIRFSNQSNMSIAQLKNYVIEFGDNNSNTSKSINDTVWTHTYNNLTTKDTLHYRVKLTTTSESFCIISHDTTIIVNNFIKPIFTIDTTKACADYKPLIKNASIGKIAKYRFFFGDGDSISQPTFPAIINNHTYTNNSNNTSASYTILMIVQNAGGCKASFDRKLEVYPKVEVGFTVPALTNFCSPLARKFTPIIKSKDTSVTYRWEFGDGTSSTDTVPFTHTFNNIDTVNKIYYTKFIAFSKQYHCSDIDSVPTFVNRYSKAGLTVDAVVGCGNLTANFTNISQGSIDTVVMDFGDGSPVVINPLTNFSRNYKNITNSSITFNPTISITSSDKCKKSETRQIIIYPAVSIDTIKSSITNGCSPLNITLIPETDNASTFLWEMGDQSTKDTKTVNHSYTSLKDTVFWAKLIASSPWCKSNDSIKIEIYASVQASFVINKTYGCSPLKVKLARTSTGVALQTPKWDYGTGKEFVTDSILYIFGNDTDIDPSVQTITLNETSSKGCSNTISKTIEIYPKVKAMFNTNSVGICTPKPFRFTSTSSDNAIYYNWSFGDGTSSNEQIPIKTYNNLQDTTDRNFVVKLTASSKYYCSHDTSMTITTYPYVKASFDIDKFGFCSYETPKLTNTSRGLIQTYTWSFPNNNTSSVKNPLFPSTIKNTGNIINNSTIKLIVMNGRNCIDSITRTISLYPEVQISIAQDKTEACQPEPVKFSDAINKGFSMQYNWNFGDSTTSNEASPSHIYKHFSKNDSMYNIRLIANSEYYCVDTATATFKSYSYLKTDFKVQNSEICSGESILLTNSSAPSAKMFYWDNDGNGTFDDSSTVFKPRTITYLNNAQNYELYKPNLTLKIRNERNCFGVKSKIITVHPQVIAAFSNVSAGCHPFKLSITNDSRNAELYDWTFSDGRTSNFDKPTLTFNNYTDNNINYTIKLVASSDFWCTDSTEKTITVYHKPIADIFVEKYVDCPPFEVKVFNNTVTSNSVYYYDLGDGSPVDFKTNKQTISKTYKNTTSSIKNYTIRMTAESGTGGYCKDSAKVQISVYPEVKANFDTIIPACHPYALSSINNTSKNAQFYLWDFNDGQTSSMFSPGHIFNNSTEFDKDFRVSLKAWSEKGCNSSISKTVRVYPSPKVLFNVDSTLIYYPSRTFAIFNNSNTTKTGNWNYLWQFGDRQIDKTRDPVVHKYETWGVYTIRQKTWNAVQPKCADSSSLIVQIVPAKPIANFAPPAWGCMPWTIQFENKSIWEKTYLWDFGDSLQSKSTEKNPVFTYNKAGEYYVKLSVEGDGGTDYHYETVIIYQKPIAKFSLEPRRVMLPDDVVKCFNFSKYATHYIWDFGEDAASTSTEKFPVFKYSKLGNYDVKLLIWNDENCYDTLIVEKAIEVEGLGQLRYPNAFVPNLTGEIDNKYVIGSLNNQLFYPYSEGVADYLLEIYNRWGERIFYTKDINVGWNGYFKGKLCPQDVYIYKATGRFFNGKTFSKSGDITLLYKEK